MNLAGPGDGCEQIRNDGTKADPDTIPLRTYSEDAD